jgi:CelD/BcsL family acetyltransferase involved in cellulose biosynthesis
MARHQVHGLEVVVHPTFELAEQPWREIEARGAGFVFQSFDWCLTWFETIGRALDVNPVLVHVHDWRTGAEMFLPLGIERKRHGMRALGFLANRLADHTAPVLAGTTDIAFDDVRTDAILRRVAEATGADVLDFWHLRAKVDERRNPLVNSRAKLTSYATHSLKLDGTWEAFCTERLSKGRRADNRRCWRRLQEQGTASLVIAESVEQALAILESTLAQKARRYRNTGRLNLFAMDAYPEFYRRMTARHHPSGLVHVAA